MNPELWLRPTGAWNVGSADSGASTSGGWWIWSDVGSCLLRPHITPQNYPKPPLSPRPKASWSQGSFHLFVTCCVGRGSGWHIQQDQGVSGVLSTRGRTGSDSNLGSRSQGRASSSHCLDGWLPSRLGLPMSCADSVSSTSGRQKMCI